MSPKSPATPKATRLQFVGSAGRAFIGLDLFMDVTLKDAKAFA